MADPTRLLPQQRITSPYGHVENPIYSTRSNSPYAVDLIPFQFKYKFLYVVTIDILPKFQTGNKSRFALLTRTASRPSPKFETEEINMYGIRVPITKRTKFDPVTLTFLDDNQNEMMNFFATASRWMSPVTTLHPDQDVENLQYDFQYHQPFDGDGKNRQPDTQPHRYAVSANPEPFVESVTVYHVYEYGNRVNVFKYAKPVITELALDDLDMSSNEPTTLKVSLDYTHVYTQLGLPMSRDIAELVGSTTYHMRNDLK